MPDTPPLTILARAMRESPARMQLTYSPEAFEELARAGLAALEGAGYVVVPAMPTQDMEDAADEPFHDEFRKQAKRSQEIAKGGWPE